MKRRTTRVALTNPHNDMRHAPAVSRPPSVPWPRSLGSVRRTPGLPPGAVVPRGSRRSRGSVAGFTLLEVALVCAVLAVLAAYAVPAYTGHLMRGHRAEAKVALYQAAQWVERLRADAAHDPAGSGGLTLPAGLDQAPPQGTAVYRLDMLPANATNGGYTLQAQPVATGPMGADEECGVFELDATGRRANRASGLGDKETAERCWNS